MLDLATARAAYRDAWITAAEATDSILAPARARMESAMTDARLAGTPVPRREIAAYLAAGQLACDTAHAIRSGPAADLDDAMRAAREQQ